MAYTYSKSRIFDILAAAVLCNLAGVTAIGIFLFCYVFFFTKYFWICYIYVGWVYYDRHKPETGEGSFPHGFICAGVTSVFGSEACGFSALFPGLTPYILVSSNVFYIPVLRELCLMAGFCSVSRSALHNFIGKESGGNCAVVMVGGAPEARATTLGKYKFFLKKRRGFVREALKHGSPLVPVITFGENDIYERRFFRDDSWIQKCFNAIGQRVGICSVIAGGDYFWIPYRRPLTVVVGHPIEMPKVKDPNPETIDEFHYKFVKALTSLFEENKHKYLQNPENTFVEIM